MNSALRKIISLEIMQGSGNRLPPAEGRAPDAELGTLLLLTRDAEALEWAPRWLTFSGFSVATADSVDGVLEKAALQPRTLVIVDAAMPDVEHRKAYLRLRSQLREHTPILALCMNQRESREVRESGKADAVERPFQWDKIARFARREAEAAELRSKLEHTTRALKIARLNAADAERNLAEMRGIDSLTELPNRELFRSLLQRAISGAPAGETTGILVVGIDRFRQVNATVGHEAGNAIICQFAERLRNRLQDHDVVGGDAGTTLTAAGGRIGGVRFGLVLSRAGVDDLVRLRDAFQSDMEQPFEVNGQSVYLSATMGAALFPIDASNGDQLLECAEHAMCAAKDAGSSFRFFNKATDAAGRRALRIETMMRQALVNDELRLAYQPIMHREGPEVVAAEALLRWDHPVEGPISPAEFVPAAERSGLMVRIGDFVLREAVRQIRRWQDEGLPRIRVAVNLSLCQLADGNVVPLVQELLERHDVEPELLELELSERGVLNQGPEIVAVVRELKELGVRISIDDFGSGNSAISYLKDLPVDVVKIDRSYVSGPGRSERDEAIGAGMVALAKRLDATVVAEGVENEAQLERVRDWGCDEVQGFHYSEAVTPARLASRLVMAGREPVRAAASRMRDRGRVPRLRTLSLPGTC